MMCLYNTRTSQHFSGTFLLKTPNSLYQPVELEKKSSGHINLICKLAAHLWHFQYFLDNYLVPFMSENIEVYQFLKICVPGERKWQM